MLWALKIIVPRGDLSSTITPTRPGGSAGRRRFESRASPTNSSRLGRSPLAMSAAASCRASSAHSGCTATADLQVVSESRTLRCAGMSTGDRLRPLEERALNEAVRSYELVVMGGRYAICRLGPKALVPSWVDHGRFWSVSPPPTSCRLFAKRTSRRPERRPTAAFWVSRCSAPSICPKSVCGPGLTGALAAKGISMLAISTFDTDYIFVKEEVLPDAIRRSARGGPRRPVLAGNPLS